MCRYRSRFSTRTASSSTSKTWHLTPRRRTAHRGRPNTRSRPIAAGSGNAGSRPAPKWKAWTTRRPRSETGRHRLTSLKKPQSARLAGRGCDTSAKKYPLVTGCRHEEQHGDGEHGVGPRCEERHSTRFSFFRIGRRHQAQYLFLVRPDQHPDVEEHDRAEPGSYSDRIKRTIQQKERF